MNVLVVRHTDDLEEARRIETALIKIKRLIQLS